MIRLFDFIFSLLGLVLLSPVLIVISLIGFFDNGSPIFRQKRLGCLERPFILVKFRTMRRGTKSVPSHLVGLSSITAFGSFLRTTKLDELPQLWNVLKGDMSLIGPRPGLVDQIELRNVRRTLGVFSVKPGISGLSQINRINMSTPKLLAETDAKMIKDISLKNYFKYIFLTILGRGSGDAARR